jgi:hypothetical protein
MVKWLTKIEVSHQESQHYLHVSPEAYLLVTNTVWMFTHAPPRSSFGITRSCLPKSCLKKLEPRRNGEWFERCSVVDATGCGHDADDKRTRYPTAGGTTLDTSSTNSIPTLPSLNPITMTFSTSRHPARRIRSRVTRILVEVGESIGWKFPWTKGSRGPWLRYTSKSSLNVQFVGLC